MSDIIRDEKPITVLAVEPDGTEHVCTTTEQLAVVFLKCPHVQLWFDEVPNEAEKYDRALQRVG